MSTLCAKNIDIRATFLLGRHNCVTLNLLSFFHKFANSDINYYIYIDR